MSFAELGTSKPSCARSPSATSPSRSPSSSWSSRDALAGHDLLVQSPTGSGKTLAFGVPLVDLLEPGAERPSALILAPTRELAAQIVDELDALARARGLRVAAVYGGVGFGPQIEAAQARRHPRRHPRPARGPDRPRRDRLDAASSVLVLDEADRMLDMGFRPAVDRIVG